jgi:DNA-directed RNA polymerase specialized sigma24 family protein
MKVRKHKIDRVRIEFARLGKICHVVAVTGYSRTLVSAVVNGHAEASACGERDIAVHNSCDMDCLPAPEPVNMENFGELQYIIDKLPEIEQFVLRQYFIHNWTKTRIANQLGRSRSVVYRILKNLEELKDECSN